MMDDDDTRFARQDRRERLFFRLAIGVTILWIIVLIAAGLAVAITIAAGGQGL